MELSYTNTSGFFLEPHGFLELGPQCAATESPGIFWPDINISISAAGSYMRLKQKSNFLKLKSTPVISDFL